MLVTRAWMARHHSLGGDDGTLVDRAGEVIGSDGARCDPFAKIDVDQGRIAATP